MDDENLADRVAELERQVEALVDLAKAQAELLEALREHDAAVEQLMRAQREVLARLGHAGERRADRKR